MPGYVYRGAQPLPPPKPPAEPKRKRTPPECGTIGGYTRHKRLGESMDDACWKANADYCKQRRDQAKGKQ